MCFRDLGSESFEEGLAADENLRTVYVSKDPVTGFGLTLGGEQPVYVQTVRPGGAADKAGVRKNDIVVKVNGKRVVTEATHNEVVSLISGRTESS